MDGKAGTTRDVSLNMTGGDGYYVSTHLQKEGVPVDNNGAERVNRRFVSVRNDGGGNRSQTGMDVNFVLFTIKTTNYITKGTSTIWSSLRLVMDDAAPHRIEKYIMRYTEHNFTMTGSFWVL